MTHVIYNIVTTRLLSRKTYATATAAKAGLTRAAKADTTMIKSDYAIAEAGLFHATIEKSTERTNMMSGAKYMEPINTPLHSSPASESYWSM
jgi:hypothetical protein